VNSLKIGISGVRGVVGFAHDADGERLGVVTETGEMLSEEATLVLAADWLI
jgi:phosphomannomutase